jgi:5-formyltetrahydrofolate cyclo-ligase
MTSLKQQKKEFRKKFLQKRDSLSPAAKALKSRQIQSRLLTIPDIRSAHTIFIYVSFKSEVETHDLIRTALMQGKIIAVPFTDSRNKKLVPSCIANINELTPGTLGIPEPHHDSVHPLSLEKIDVIITPGIVFSEKGWRLGYGGGYYDRFLHATTHKSFALAYEFQIVQDIPYDDHYDKAVDYIVTENRIITCK